MPKPLEAIGNSLSPDSADLSVLRQDLKALKNDAKDLKDDALQIGAEKARQASAIAREQLQEAKKQASDTFAKSETYIRENPGQSVAVAFLAGALLSLVLGGRR